MSARDGRLGDGDGDTTSRERRPPTEDPSGDDIGLTRAEREAAREEAAAGSPFVEPEDVTVRQRGSQVETFIPEDRTAAIRRRQRSAFASEAAEEIVAADPEDVIISDADGQLTARLPESVIEAEQQRQRDLFREEVAAEYDFADPGDIELVEEGDQVTARVDEETITSADREDLDAVIEDLRTDVASQYEDIGPEAVAVEQTDQGLEARFRELPSAVEADYRTDVASQYEDITPDEVSVEQTEGGFTPRFEAVPSAIAEDLRSEAAAGSDLVTESDITVTLDDGGFTTQLTEGADQRIQQRQADQFRQQVAAQYEDIGPADVDVELTDMIIDPEAEDAPDPEPVDLLESAQQLWREDAIETTQLTETIAAWRSGTEVASAYPEPVLSALEDEFGEDAIQEQYQATFLALPSEIEQETRQQAAEQSEFVNPEDVAVRLEDGQVRADIADEALDRVRERQAQSIEDELESGWAPDDALVERVVTSSPSTVISAATSLYREGDLEEADLERTTELVEADDELTIGMLPAPLTDAVEFEDRLTGEPQAVVDRAEELYSAGDIDRETLLATTEWYRGEPDPSAIPGPVFEQIDYDADLADVQYGEWVAEDFQTEALTTAIELWREDAIETTQLTETVAAWRSDEVTAADLPEPVREALPEDAVAGEFRTDLLGVPAHIGAEAREQAAVGSEFVTPEDIAVSLDEGEVVTGVAEDAMGMVRDRQETAFRDEVAAEYDDITPEDVDVEWTGEDRLEATIDQPMDGPNAVRGTLGRVFDDLGEREPTAVTGDIPRGAELAREQLANVEEDLLEARTVRQEQFERRNYAAVLPAVRELADTEAELWRAGEGAPEAFVARELDAQTDWTDITTEDILELDVVSEAEGISNPRLREAADVDPTAVTLQPELSERAEIGLALAEYAPANRRETPDVDGSQDLLSTELMDDGSAAGQETYIPEGATFDDPGTMAFQAFIEDYGEFEDGDLVGLSRGGQVVSDVGDEVMVDVGARMEEPARGFDMDPFGERVLEGTQEFVVEGTQTAAVEAEEALAEGLMEMGEVRFPRPFAGSVSGSLADDEVLGGLDPITEEGVVGERLAGSPTVEQRILPGLQNTLAEASELWRSLPDPQFVNVYSGVGDDVSVAQPVRHEEAVTAVVDPGNLRDILRVGDYAYEAVDTPLTGVPAAVRTGRRLATDAIEYAVESPSMALTAIGTGALVGSAAIRTPRALATRYRSRAIRRDTDVDADVGFEEFISEAGLRDVDDIQGYFERFPDFESDPSAPTRAAVRETRARAADVSDDLQELIELDTESYLYHTTPERLGQRVEVGEGTSELPGLWSAADPSSIGLVEGAETTGMLSRLRPRVPRVFDRDRISVLPGDDIRAMPDWATGSGYVVRGPDDAIVARNISRTGAEDLAEEIGGRRAPEPETEGYRFLDELADPDAAYVRPQPRSPELETIHPPGGEFVRMQRLPVDMPSGRTIPADIYRRVDDVAEEAGDAADQVIDAARQRGDVFAAEELPPTRISRPAATRGSATATGSYTGGLVGVAAAATDSYLDDLERTTAPSITRGSGPSEALIGTPSPSTPSPTRLDDGRPPSPATARSTDRTQASSSVGLVDWEPPAPMTRRGDEAAVSRRLIGTTGRSAPTDSVGYGPSTPVASSGSGLVSEAGYEAPSYGPSASVSESVSEPVSYPGPSYDYSFDYPFDLSLSVSYSPPPPPPGGSVTGLPSDDDDELDRDETDLDLALWDRDWVADITDPLTGMREAFDDEVNLI